MPWLDSPSHPLPAPNFGRRVALVLGNGKYHHAGTLKNPASDAICVAEVLIALGFEVIGGRQNGLDLGYGEFAARIRDFERRLRDEVDVALLFYAGHGMQVDGRNYLVPIDAALEYEADVGSELFELQRILNQMERPKRTSVVLLDACRNNPLAQNLARAMGVGGTRSSHLPSGLGEQKVVSGTLIAYATQPGHVAYDGAEQNGYFTEALLANMRAPGREIELMLKDVRAQVIEATKDKTQGPQVPWVHSSLVGSFSFAPSNQESTAVERKKSAPSTVGSRQEQDFAPSDLVRVEIGLSGSGHFRSLAPGAGKTDWFRDGPDLPELVLVPRGRCSGADGTIAMLDKPLAVGRFLTTVDEFTSFVRDTKHALPDSAWTYEGLLRRQWKERTKRTYLSPGFPQNGRHPVVAINWNDATAYTAWLSSKTSHNYRLLTHSEWNYVVGQWRERSTNPTSQWAEADSIDGTAPVETFDAGPWGIYPQTGRVWEWCSDHWGLQHSTASADPRRFEEGIVLLRQLRGGVLQIFSDGLGRACQRWGSASNRISICGFRVARAL